MLPDILQKNLKLIICGNAAGKESGKRNNYYSSSSNSFWKTLHEAGLTPRRLTPMEDFTLPSYGIGLTDLVKGYSGPDSGLPKEQLENHNLINLIERYQPRGLAFNGLQAAKNGLNLKDRPRPGEFMHHGFDTIRVWVLPSTSGRAIRYFSLQPWEQVSNWLETA